MEFVSPYIVFSAPSGGGKTTIVQHLAKKYDNLKISISATTRKKRPDEVDGIAYHFLSKDQFEQKIKSGCFLEYEIVHGDYYGTLKESVNDLVKSGNSVLFDIDVNGALSIKMHYPEAILIFIAPPSLDVLKERLVARKSESSESVENRLKRIKYEYEKADSFDFKVINDQLDATIEEVEQLIVR
ncbi:MAG: guanylate kinase [Calditrichaceae bacterium]